MSISTQFNDLRSNPPEYVGVGLKNFNFKHWEAYINGPRGTPYEGGLFTMEIVFPDNYPESAPVITMKTQIYHPNVNDLGNICIDIIKGAWKSHYTMRFILNAIVGILQYPNANNPWPNKRSIADQLKNNKNEFNRTARQWTEEHAM